jgi:UDP-2,3-diacylglucosamine pyrophosphatase LpxH
VAYEANKHSVDGLICGHIHRANLRDVNGIEYCNTGDWVESCTALVEHYDGRLELINWAELKRQAAIRQSVTIPRAA